MQAVILAAGIGKRLGHLTKNSTKCMVPLNGRKLIEYTFDALAETPVKRVVMVVGHGSNEVKKFLGSRFRDIEIIYIDNPIYAQSNNIYSLLLAKDYMEQDDTLLLESDVVFAKTLLEDCVRHEAPNLAVVAKFQSWMDGTVTTLTPQHHIINFISKKDMDWSEPGKYYKTVNIYKLSKEISRQKLFPFLKTYIETKGLHEYYEEVLKVLTFIDVGTLQAFEMGDRIWYEIDDIQDLDIAGVLFANEKNRLALLKKRYGGYWRFPFLKDFCYLVNPYFPSKRMFLEFGQNLPVLLSSYPSGQRVQNLLAAKMYNCPEEYFLVGNGASELISGLMKELDGPVGIHVPTFDEYMERAKPGQLIEFRSADRDFHYGADDILEFVTANKIANYILINPDNPTGHFLAKLDVLALSEKLQKKNVRLILDESFADFVDGTAEHSFLAASHLEKHKNLVVIKSISKSYGVPGLRLGIMATSDGELLKKVWKHVSIWNINSFAESFLQIIDKYKNDFQAGCRQIAEERARFFAELQKIDFLHPFLSKANYILCQLKGDRTSGELAKELLNEKWIFIKDCAGKKGFPEGSYVRLTVRDRQDNDFLLAALKSLS
jgi:histidinol-phosphate/aromatic aminotransferase/cobyric acid decarboxylase-like protein/choline kinase